MFYAYGMSFFEQIGQILAVIFEEMLTPIITDLVEFIVYMIGELLLQIFQSVLYFALKYVLVVIDMFEQFFDILCGLRPVISAGEKVDILDVFLLNSSVETIFWKLTALAFALGFLFAIYGAARSAVDESGKHSPAVLLRDSMKMAGNLMIVPVLVFFGIKLASVVINQLDYALSATFYSDGERPTTATLIFLSGTTRATGMFSSDTAQWRENYVDNVKGEWGGEGARTSGIREGVREKYYNGDRSYADEWHVWKDFDMAEYDWVIAFAGAIMILILFFGNSLYFCKRILELLLLYLLVPLTISTYPIDGGKMYNEWKGFFLGRCAMAFGGVFGMRTYLMFLPVLVGGEVSFLSIDAIQRFRDAPIDVNQAIVLLLIVGGAYSIFKAQTIVIAIVSEPFAAGMQRGLMGFFMSGFGMLKQGSGKAKEKISAGNKKGGADEGKKDGDGSKNEDSGGGSEGRQFDYFGNKLSKPPAKEENQDGQQ